MINFVFKTKLNRDTLKSELEDIVNDAQKKLDQQVLTDSNFFIPWDTGALAESGILDTVIGSGEVKWTTDYARRQYYGNYKHNKQRNVNASRLWFEQAKARFNEKWRRLINACFHRN